MSNWKTFALVIGLWWLFKGRKPKSDGAGTTIRGAEPAGYISQEYTEAPRMYGE